MQRTKTLTSKSLRNYKIVLGTLCTVALTVSVYTFLYGTFNVMGFVMIPVLLLTSFIHFRNLNLVRDVEYDDANLYVLHNDYQIQIPFEQIKEVNIVTGGFLFRLYKKTQIGMEVLCLPSIWYPLTYKKVDAEMNWVREMIAKRKREFYENKNLSNSKQLSGLNL